MWLVGDPNLYMKDMSPSSMPPEANLKLNLSVKYKRRERMPFFHLLSIHSDLSRGMPSRNGKKLKSVQRYSHDDDDDDDDDDEMVR
jgi:hypothetical protein